MVCSKRKLLHNRVVEGSVCVATLCHTQGRGRAIAALLLLTHKNQEKQGRELGLPKLQRVLKKRRKRRLPCCVYPWLCCPCAPERPWLPALPCRCPNICNVGCTIRHPLQAPYHKQSVVCCHDSTKGEREARLNLLSSKKEGVAVLHLCEKDGWRAAECNVLERECRAAVSKQEQIQQKRHMLYQVRARER